MVNVALSRGMAVTGALGLGSASLLGGAAAMAAPGDCSYPGSTAVVPGVCQLVITADGTFTFPSSLTKVSAIIVGAGGGGYYEYQFEGPSDGPYGGGGGEVLYVDSVALDTPINVVIGAGGTAGANDTLATDGDDTLFGATTARGGKAPVDSDGWLGGDSGNGHTSSGLSGGGAAGNTPDDWYPGPGYLLSTFPGVSATLFPASANGGIQYGIGGTADVDDDISITPVPANTGTGGSAIVTYDSDWDDYFPESTDGSDGVVIIRYAAEPGLAETGSDSSAAIAIGAAAAVGGAALLATAGVMRRRSRKA
ncbi:MAG: hypothetical protein KF772_03320 [Cryobacterium sp.]|nr:hypothetical protein [Cryobacterium sp.]